MRLRFDLFARVLRSRALPSQVADGGSKRRFSTVRCKLKSFLYVEQTKVALRPLTLVFFYVCLLRLAARLNIEVAAKNSINASIANADSLLYKHLLGFLTKHDHLLAM